MDEAVAAAPSGSKFTGYCFYHYQDLFCAVRGEGLYLCYGTLGPDVEGVKIGQMVQEELLRAGLPVEWNGSIAERIFIPKLRWQRRLAPHPAS